MHRWTLKKKQKLKVDLIAHFADLEPLEQENVESFLYDMCIPGVPGYPGVINMK